VQTSAASVLWNAVPTSPKGDSAPCCRAEHWLVPDSARNILSDPQNGCTNSPERSLGSNGARPVSRKDTACTPAQPVDSPTLAASTEVNPGASGAPGRRASAAPVLQDLPPPTAGLFISAGAIVAEWAVREHADRGSRPSFAGRPNRLGGSSPRSWRDAPPRATAVSPATIPRLASRISGMVARAHRKERALTVDEPSPPRARDPHGISQTSPSEGFLAWRPHSSCILLGPRWNPRRGSGQRGVDRPRRMLSEPCPNRAPRAGQGWGQGWSERGPDRVAELTARNCPAVPRRQRLRADALQRMAPKSWNHLREFLFNFFAVARKPGGPWEGRPNPVEDVERAKVTPKPRKVLAVDEWEPVLLEVPQEWRGPTAVALCAGLREGEIFGLLKSDVDLEAGVLTVWRSWDAPRTKDGKAAPVPIADPLSPRLEAALRSPGPLLFPRADGAMHSRKLRLNRMLRAAIARAGLVEGYEHRCRAAHCGWRELRQDDVVPEACPRCGKPTTWAKSIARHVTFHGARHSFGTAVVRSAGTAVAQKALRLSDVRLTIHAPRCRGRPRWHRPVARQP